jgi:hypothetical protein
MTPAEYLIRSTTRAIAETVHDVPSLLLPPTAEDLMKHNSSRRSRPRRPRSGSLHRSRPAWLAPVAAAVAMGIVAVCLVALKSTALNAPKNHVSHSVAPASSTGAGVPEYYVSTTPLGQGRAQLGLVVTDTFTGKTMATIAPPAGRTFTSVSAAADDRTFVAYAMPASGSRGQAGSWYEVRFTPGATPTARLSKLRVPPLADVVSMAVSGSGSKLAVAIVNPAGAPKSLTIYSVTTGRLLHSWPHGMFGFNTQTWTEGTQIPDLTWIDGDRDVAFSVSSVFQSSPNGPASWTAQIWHLNISRTGSNLIADSGLVWSMNNVPLDSTSTKRCTPLSTPLLSADGKTVVCVSTSASFAQTGAISYRQTTNPAPRWTVAWLAFSISAPGTARTLYATTVPAGIGVALQTAWVNASGTSALAEWGPLSSGTTLSALHFGAASNGALTHYAPPRVSGTNVNLFLPSVAW